MRNDPPKRNKRKRSNIGTENESSLHRSLKYCYAKKGATETARAGFVCDAIGAGGEAVEIQTGNFSSLKNKIPALVKNGKVRLVYPVIVNKTIELYNTRGKLLLRKRSPRKGKIWDIFKQLIYVPLFVRTRGLIIELIFVDAIERRRDDGKGSWRRKGISITDKILENRRDGIVLKKKADWLKYFLPLKGECSAKSLAKAASIGYVTARKTLYTFEKAGFILKIRKEGRSWIYKII